MLTPFAIRTTNDNGETDPYAFWGMHLTQTAMTMFFVFAR